MSKNEEEEVKEYDEEVISSDGEEEDEGEMSSDEEESDSGVKVFLHVKEKADGGMKRDFYSFLLNEENNFSDFVLKVINADGSSHVFKCHKLILSRSTLFFDLFEKDPTLNTYNIECKYSIEIVKLAMRYLYGVNFLDLLDDKDRPFLDEMFAIALEWGLPDFTHYLLLTFRKRKLKDLMEIYPKYEKGSLCRHYISLVFKKQTEKIRKIEAYVKFFKEFEEEIENSEDNLFKHTSFEGYEPTFTSERRQFISRNHSKVQLQYHITQSFEESLNLSDISLRATAPSKTQESDNIVKCHKLVLAVRSKYFRTLFTGKFTESEDKVIDMNDMSNEHLRWVIAYLYTRDFSCESFLGHRMSLNLEILCQLVLLGEKYLLRGMKKRCLYLIRMMINGSNIAQLKEKYAGYVEADKKLKRLFESAKMVMGMGKMEFRVLMVGLDAAGKTTLLYKLKLGEVVTTIPTIGFNVETVDIEGTGVKLTIWDVGGNHRIRPLWRHYYENTQGLIWVVDGNDKERFSEARDDLRRMTDEDALQGVPLLVFLNKQDLPNAASEVEKELDLETLRKGRKVQVFKSCAVVGEGVDEGIEWLVDQLW